MQGTIWRPYMDVYMRMPQKNKKDTGIIGDIIEIVGCILALLYKMGYKKALEHVQEVKAQGKPDMTMRIKNPATGKYITVRFSWKTGNGEIEVVIPEDYMIFIPVFDPEKPLYEQAYVFTREEWTAFLRGYPGRGNIIRHDKARDKNHLQSYHKPGYTPPENTDFPSWKGAKKASLSIFIYIMTECKKHPTYGEFLKKIGRYKDVKF